MEKGVNLQIIEVRKQIEDIVMSCGIPPVVLSLMLHNITDNIDNVANMVISKEQEAYNNKDKEVKKDGDRTNTTIQSSKK